MTGVGAVTDPASSVRRYDVPVPTDLVAMLAATVSARPNRLAFVDDQRELTWAQFDAAVSATAARLVAHGVAAGDRIGLLAGNGIPYTCAVWAIWRLGAIVVPLNHRLTADDLAAQLADSSCRLLLVGSGKEELGDRAAHASGTPTARQDEAGHFLSDTHPAPLPEVVVAPQTPAAILYTSGTTGRPKGVVISHGNAVQNSVTCTEVIGRRQDDTELIMVPQFNVTGLCSQTVPVVHRGMTAVLLDGFDAQRVVELVRAHRVTSTVGAPTMWWRILEAAGKAGLPSLRLALYGGAPMPVALLQRLREALPTASFGNGYGMTETCSMVTYIGGEDAIRRPDSVGRPLPVTELRLLLPDDDREVPPGEVGEVTVRGPQVALGYWHPDGIRPLTDAHGWLRTGDAARLDDGFVVLADRWKDVIKRGGESIFSLEVEEVLYQHPKVLDAAVVGVPDERYGELVLAVVVPKPGERLTEDEVQDHCRCSLARFKVPSFVQIREELPRNAGGKVIKSSLKAAFVARSEAAGQ